MGRESELIQAFQQVERGLAELDEVDLKCMEVSFDAAHRLHQLVDSRSQLITSVQSEMSQLEKTANAEEADQLAEEAAAIRETSDVSQSLFIFIILIVMLQQAGSL